MTVRGLLAEGSHKYLAEGAHKYLVFSIDSDVCYYPVEQRELTEELKGAGLDVDWITVHSEKGHDAFLLEPHLFEPHLRYHLEAEWFRR